MAQIETEKNAPHYIRVTDRLSQIKGHAEAVLADRSGSQVPISPETAASSVAQIIKAMSGISGLAREIDEILDRAPHIDVAVNNFRANTRFGLIVNDRGPVAEGTILLDGKTIDLARLSERSAWQEYFPRMGEQGSPLPRVWAEYANNFFEAAKQLPEAFQQIDRGHCGAISKALKNLPS